MEKLNSILMVVEPDDGVHRLLAKACVLTRHFGARLELFLCDAEQAYALSHAYDSRGIAEARSACLADRRRYLESLRDTVAARDLPISVDVACESPLYEGILQKVLRSCPDLVILSARAGERGRPSGGLSASAWQVIRTCPVPVMLTSGRPWRAAPAFAASVDISDEETPGLALAILRTAQFVAARCAGKLEILYCERDSAAQTARGEQALTALARDAAIAEPHVRTFEGDPAVELPRAALRAGYDLMVLGALTHRRGFAALVGTLTSKLVESLECDFILVKPGSYRAPAGS
jgi:universal stress protein E